MGLSQQPSIFLGADYINQQQREPLDEETMAKEVLIQSQLAIDNLFSTSLDQNELDENENDDTFENAGKNVLRGFNL